MGRNGLPVSQKSEASSLPNLAGVALSSGHGGEGRTGPGGQDWCPEWLLLRLLLLKSPVGCPSTSIPSCSSTVNIALSNKASAFAFARRGWGRLEEEEKKGAQSLCTHRHTKIRLRQPFGVPLSWQTHQHDSNGLLLAPLHTLSILGEWGFLPLSRKPCSRGPPWAPQK